MQERGREGGYLVFGFTKNDPTTPPPSSSIWPTPCEPRQHSLGMLRGAVPSKGVHGGKPSKKRHKGKRQEGLKTRSQLSWIHTLANNASFSYRPAWLIECWGWKEALIVCRSLQSQNRWQLNYLKEKEKQTATSQRALRTGEGGSSAL